MSAWAVPGMVRAAAATSSMVQVLLMSSRKRPDDFFMGCFLLVLVGWVDGGALSSGSVGRALSTVKSFGGRCEMFGTGAAVGRGEFLLFEGGYSLRGLKFLSFACPSRAEGRVPLIECFGVFPDGSSRDHTAARLARSSSG
ncbi:hypothetical protein GCM10010309_50840 [Streptomyces violaceochromogenes]|nr:hypothetical protein GCM10010309_50840 [Streptomyces violaceochromogenes]